jgi:ketopantoate reductase
MDILVLDAGAVGLIIAAKLSKEDSARAVVRQRCASATE